MGVIHPTGLGTLLGSLQPIADIQPLELILELAQERHGALSADSRLEEYVRQGSLASSTLARFPYADKQDKKRREIPKSEATG